MKKILFILLAAVFLSPSFGRASDIGVDLDIHIGNRQPVPIIVEEPPLFLVPAALGFQVAVGVPYGLFHIDGSYYLCRDNIWYAAPVYGGPWTVIRHERLPPGLAKRRYSDLIALRDEEYRHFRQDGDRYRGKVHRPERSGKEHGKGKHKKYDD